MSTNTSTSSMPNAIPEHPLYSEYKEKYREYNDFYKGGEYIEDNAEYLPQHPYESDKQYEIRRALATYKNHAKPIVSVFSSSIWRREPDRKLPAKLEAHIKDVDGAGAHADTFFLHQNENSAAMGVYFVVVDSPLKPEDVKTKEDEINAGLNIRPHFVPVSPLDVIAWGHDGQTLTFVVIKESLVELKAQDNPFEGYNQPIQYKIWYRDRWETYRLTTEADGKQGLSMHDSGNHKCGAVPIIPCYFSKKYEMTGESCFNDVLSLIQRIYNLENSLDKQLFDTAFPQQEFSGFEPEEIKNYIKSSSNGLVARDPNAHSRFVEPSGKSYEAISNKISSDEKSIREIVLRMLRPESKQVESADSKKLDKLQLDSILAVFSRSCEEFEINCWKMAGRWMGLSEGELNQIEIKYNDDFDVEKLSDEMIKMLSDMVAKKQLSLSTFWEILKVGEMPLPADFDPVEEQAKIENESRSSNMGITAGRFLTGTALAAQAQQVNQ